VSRGYRSPKKVRHLHKRGLKHHIISSAKDLEGLDTKKDCLIISSSLGNKKRIIILKKAKDSGFDILNFKNPYEFIKKIEDKISLRKRKKEEEKVKEVKKSEKKEKLTEKVTEEEKKEIAKKEKDKLLTKKRV
jgi:hypothetical protein